jgi:hypothetical protein
VAVMCYPGPRHHSNGRTAQPILGTNSTFLSLQAEHDFLNVQSERGPAEPRAAPAVNIDSILYK